MIEIPTCLKCERVKKHMLCEAFPDGIPDEELYKERKNNTECNNGVTFKSILEK